MLRGVYAENISNYFSFSLRSQFIFTMESRYLCIQQTPYHYWRSRRKDTFSKTLNDIGFNQGTIRIEYVTLRYKGWTTWPAIGEKFKIQGEYLEVTLLNSTFNVKVKCPTSYVAILWYWPTLKTDIFWVAYPLTQVTFIHIALF